LESVAAETFKQYSITDISQTLHFAVFFQRVISVMLDSVAADDTADVSSCIILYSPSCFSILMPYFPMYSGVLHSKSSLMELSSLILDSLKM